MPNTYTRKTTRQSWSEESMAQALASVENGSFGYLSASKQFGVPKSTLERRFKGKNKHATGNSKTLGSRKMTFPFNLEQELVAYVKNMEGMLFGLSSRSVRSLAYQLAVRNNIPHNFNNEKKMAGWCWLRSFMKRNKLSLRLPEATSAARARGFNREAVAAFFDILEPLQEKFNFPPSKIFNVDETGITTVQGRPSKIVAARGRKQVGTLSSAERGELSTAVICMSASGVFVPPMLIIPRVRMKPQFMVGTPPGTLVVAHKSGWMQLDLFVQWFDHFLLHTQASKANPVLLILDGHKTHTQNLSIIDKARNNGVTIVCLPPHCSHRMQPLDVAFMAPLSRFYTEQIEIWLRNHPGRYVTVCEVPSLFGNAYLRASTPINAINGFQKTGIHPVNRTIFTEDMFAATLPTNRPLEEDDSERRSPNPQEDVPEIVIDNIETTPKRLIDINQTRLAPEINDLNDLPSTSHGPTYFSPDQIAPYPQAPKTKLKASQRKRGKSVILTSTPYKDELENSLKMKSPAQMNLKKIRSNTKIQSLNEKQPKKVLKGKGKENMPVQSSDSEEDDTECFYCNKKYSTDIHGEGWIRCCSCKKWAHDACAGADDDDDIFICDHCKSD
jgi:DDE superfamily endonuclease/helix-turn-helix, Psq domain